MAEECRQACLRPVWFFPAHLVLPALVLQLPLVFSLAGAFGAEVLGTKPHLYSRADKFVGQPHAGYGAGLPI